MRMSDWSSDVCSSDLDRAELLSRVPSAPQQSGVPVPAGRSGHRAEHALAWLPGTATAGELGCGERGDVRPVRLAGAADPWRAGCARDRRAPPRLGLVYPRGELGRASWRASVWQYV